MIHTVEVDTEISPSTLQKEFRKKLMTGGAILKVKSDLSAEDRLALFHRYLELAGRNNLASLVLIELARAAELSGELSALLAASDVPGVSQALAERADANSELGEQSREAILRSKYSQIKLYGAAELRQFFQQHLGGTTAAIAGRLALCQHPELPSDLVTLLARDSEPVVRYQARLLCAL